MKDINKSVINAMAVIAMLGVIGCGDENTAGPGSADDGEPTSSTDEWEECYRDADCDGNTEYFSDTKGMCEPSTRWGGNDNVYICDFREGWADNWVPDCYEYWPYISDWPEVHQLW